MVDVLKEPATPTKEAAVHANDDESKYDLVALQEGSSRFNVSGDVWVGVWRMNKWKDSKLITYDDAKAALKAFLEREVE